MGVSCSRSGGKSHPELIAKTIDAMCVSLRPPIRRDRVPIWERG